MKKIGILGGMSAASSILYYQKLVRLTQARVGGVNGPDLILRSLNFATIAPLMDAGEWDQIGAMLNTEARALEEQGAELLVLATNTMHKLEAQVMAGVTIPLLHIGEVTAQALVREDRKRPAFLATKFTMEEAFYLEKLQEAGLDPLVPNADERAEINRIIFEELCAGDVRETSRQTYIDIVARLKGEGADSVILGCTEICLLLTQENAGLPAYDTTALHCEAVMDAALT